MELFTLCKSEQWQEILEKLSQKSKLVMSLTDPGGKIFLTSSGVRNPLCTEIRNKPEALKFICSQTNTAMTQMVSRTKEPVVETCEGGMLRVAVPVLFEGEILGQITGCGVLDNPDEIDAFYLSKQTGLEESVINEMIKDIEICLEETVASFSNEILDELQKIG